MSNLKRLLLSTVFCFSLASQADDPEVSIDDFAFLTGFWVGDGFGGVSEEMWMPPSGDRMFGIFKQSNDGALQFTEFIEIVEESGGWILRLKHFNPDFSGWETKDDHVTFALRSVADNKAVFAGLSYELVEKDRLRIELRLRQDDGSVNTAVFNLNRQAL